MSHRFMVGVTCCNGAFLAKNCSVRHEITDYSPSPRAWRSKECFARMNLFLKHVDMIEMAELNLQRLGDVH